MALIISDHTKRWPGGCVVWRFHSAMSEAERTTMRRAMERWQEGDRDVRFIERSTQTSFVEFTPDGDVDGVNRSEIGMRGGLQRLWLEPITSTNNRLRSAQHELGHTLGMHHEQVRCDRDDFVRIDMSKIPLMRYGDYAKQCGDDYRIVGDYDFGSIMHYRPRTTVTTDGSTDITAVDGADGPALTAPRRLTAGDGAAVAALHSGTAHVYQLSGDGQIERTVRQYGWSSGWTTATPFGMGPLRFLFLVKASNGRALVLRIELDGSIGGTVDDRNWSSGWTSATAYAIGPLTYLYLYKRGNGTRHLNRIDADGTIGPQAVPSATIEDGWTTIRRYAIGLDNFLLYANADTGAMRIRRIDWDGTEGTPVHTWDEPAGWTSVEPYTAGGQRHLLLLGAGNGTFRIRHLRDDGRAGAVSDSGDLGTGWSTALPYEVSGDTYLLLYRRTTGDLRIRRLRPDGTLGATTDRRLFGPGWDLARPYRVGLGTYVLLVASGS